MNKAKPDCLDRYMFTILCESIEYRLSDKITNHMSVYVKEDLEMHFLRLHVAYVHLHHYDHTTNS